MSPKANELVGSRTPLGEAKEPLTAEFAIDDVHQAAFLDLRGITVRLEAQNNRVIFIAPRNEDTLRALSEYQFGREVRVTEYVDRLKALRAKMLDLKHAGR